MENKITIKYGLRVRDADAVEISINRLIELIKSKKYDNKPIIEYFGGGPDGLNQKVHPYFDIDIDRTSLDKVETTTTQPDGSNLVVKIEPPFDGFFETACAYICQEFKTTKEAFKISTCHRPDKFSCHIIIPSITTTLQNMINWKYTKKKEIIKNYLDESVYRKGGLRIVGTSKAGLKSPLVIENGSIDDLKNHLVTYVEDGAPISWTCEADVKKITKKDIKKKEHTDEILNQLVQNEFDLPEHLMNEVNVLMGLLSHDRCERYEDWINTGMCLNNITQKGFEIWEEWSRQSPKFQEGVCQSKWNTFMRQTSPNINTLRFWAHFDSPKEYEEKYVSIQLEKYIKNIFIKNGSTTSVANLINLLHGKKFSSVICQSVVSWFIFQGHRWFIYENDSVSDVIIRNEIKGLLTEYYFKLLNQLKEDPENDYLTKLIDKANKVMIQIEDIRFRQKCALDFAMLVCQKDFIKKLNKNTKLLCFENGVYDFEADTFRNGKPEDYITLSTGYDYMTFKDSDERIVQIFKFMGQLFPQEPNGGHPLMENTLKLLGSFLCDGNNLQKFHIWTGNGRNGKSALLKLLQMCLGEYIRLINASHFTQKQYSQTGAPCPDIIRLNGAKMVYTCEPEENSSFNLGVIKNWTGQDNITARNLFEKNLTDFQANFALVLICNNIPKMPSTITDSDLSVLKRLFITPFESNFIDKPNPEKPFEFLVDTQLETTKFPIWKQVFMFIIIEYARNFIKGGNNIPTLKYNIEQVDKYRKEGSVFHLFFENSIIKTESDDDFITLSDLWDQFKHDKLFHSKISRKSCKEYFSKIGRFEERPYINGIQYHSVFFNLKWDKDPTNTENKPDCVFETD